MFTLLKSFYAPLCIAFFCFFISACQHLTTAFASKPSVRDSAESKTVLNARYVPERSDDFAWENDVVAFRAYGPALRDSAENAGTDCWLKRVNYPIIDKWYDLALNHGQSYHDDHGEGLDNYHVGASLGCGGTALLINGQFHSLETYVSWSDLSINEHALSFTLHYKNVIDNDVYEEQKTISLVPNARLFKVISTFKKNGKLAVNQPLAVGVTTHNGWPWQAHAAEKQFERNKQWFAVWEVIGDAALGTAVIVPDHFDVVDVTTNIQPDNQSAHALLASSTNEHGQFEYFAGYAWEKAGAITSFDQWQSYLHSFSSNSPYK